MFSIVEIQGKQYKVSKGDIIDVDSIAGNVGDVLSIGKILLLARSDSVKIEMTDSSKKTVKVKIAKQYRDKKIDVRRFKAKVRVRRHNGFRAERTKLEILSLE